MSADSANDVLFGSGVPSAKFKTIGDSVTGKIVKLDASQQTEFRRDGKPGDPLTWPDGKPKMQVIVTLQTTQRDPSVEDDDGQRRVFIKGKQLTDATKAAVRAARAKRLDVGGTFTVVFVREEESDWGGSATKFYEIEYVPPSAAAANTALGLAETPTAAPAQQQQLDVAGLTPEAQAALAKLLAQQGAK